MAKMIDETTVMVEGVRLSFSDLFRARAFEEGAKEKFGAAVIIDPDTPSGRGNLTALKKAVDAVVAGAEGWKGRMPPNAKNWLLAKGEDKLTTTGEVRPEYEGMYVLSAKTDKRPTLVGRNREQVVEEDELFFSGCYVNLVVRVYAVTRKNPCIAGDLKGVQFVRAGEAFGRSPLRNDVFDILGDEDMTTADAADAFF